LGASGEGAAFLARPRLGWDFVAALLAAGALAGAVLAAVFAEALAVRVPAFAGAFVAVLVARRVVAAPLDDLAAEPLAPAVVEDEEDLAAVRFTGSSAAGRALVAAT
jgi:hypothetical protein